MNLTDLNPGWVYYGGEGVTAADGATVPRREGIGIAFDCPCGSHEHKDWNRVYVEFENPLDGGPPTQPKKEAQWKRTGDTFETLTLHPSIRRIGGCGWHGWVRGGKVITA